MQKLAKNSKSAAGASAGPVKRLRRSGGRSLRTARFGAAEQMLTDLANALRRGELRLHYQPKIDAQRGEVVGVEALLRWTHPTRGEMQPSQFVTVAEGTRLIHGLTMWTLDVALRQARAWLDDGVEVPVAVNLSVEVAETTGLVAEVRRRLERSRVPARLLELELTETAKMNDRAAVERTVRGLSKLGVKVSLDDFGAGYSTLAYLATLPVKELKIDKVFIDGLLSSRQSETIVKSIIDLAHKLRLTVVAEGVEDEKTWARLMKLGCDTAQGYLFGRAQTAQELDLVAA